MPAKPTRVVYDGLQIGFHTWIWTEDETRLDEQELAASGKEYYHLTGQPDVFPNEVVEINDLHDPKSRRAFIARDHIARKVARIVGATEAPAAPAGR